MTGNEYQKLRIEKFPTISIDVDERNDSIHFSDTSSNIYSLISKN